MTHVELQAAKTPCSGAPRGQYRSTIGIRPPAAATDFAGAAVAQVPLPSAPCSAWSSNPANDRRPESHERNFSEVKYYEYLFIYLFIYLF